MVRHRESKLWATSSSSKKGTQVIKGFDGDKRLRGRAENMRNSGGKISGEKENVCEKVAKKKDGHL